jgi:predicted transcriptional regulator of viral defense system
MKHGVFLRQHPVFTGNELLDHMQSLGEVGERSREALLAYYTKTGRIVRVRRGLYAVIPSGENVERYPVDPFLVAAKLTPDALLSHHTALEFHGKAHTVLDHLIYSSSRPLSALTFRSHVFRGTHFPPALLRAGNEYIGTLDAESSGEQLRVASLERTLVDVLDRPDLTGSWEEIWRSLESVEFFDLDKVVEYAHVLGNATTGAKLGFFLEQHREQLMVTDRHLNAIRELRPRSLHYMNRSRRISGRLVQQWNLVVPLDVLERTWEELL